MIIYDWDDTLQKNLNPKSSFGMFVKTLIYPCNNELVKQVFKNDDHIIVTTRSKLYTLAIKIKCFLCTFNFKALSDSKVTTINPYFFFRPTLKKRDDENMADYLLRIENLKLRFISVYNEFAFDKERKYTYVDFDLLPEMRKENLYEKRKDIG